MRRGALLLCAALLLTACQGRAQTLTIGTKSFAEQKILAEIIRGLLRDKTGAALAITTCGDTFSCRRQLRSGEIDLMVEYSGTASIYAGAAGATDLSALQKAYAPLGLKWLAPLGFDNGYRVAISGQRARAEKLASIADLAMAGPIRVACPPTYLHRPRDGLAALATRHGLRLAGKPLTLADPDARVAALLSGRADAAIVYATDAALVGRDVVLLKDTLAFFPPYDAIVLARDDATARVPALATALAKLREQIDAKTMQKLNYAVRVEGFSPAVVAERFLRERGLADAEAPAQSGPPLTIAAARADHLGPSAQAAVRAVHEVFPDRPVVLDRSRDPMTALTAGHAHLALLGAERFFTGTGRSLSRIDGVEAAAVVANRAVHVVRRKTDTRDPLAGKLGSAPKDSGSARAIRALLSARGLAPVASMPVPALLSAVEAGTLDAAVFLATPGDLRVADALSGKALSLVALAAPAPAPPYLRPGRIAPATYPGQAAPVDTLVAQLVIAGPSRTRAPVLAGGPGAAAPAQPAPLSIDEATALAAATGISDMPDPVLPSLWTRWPHGAVQPDKPTSRPALNTALSLAALAFLGWLVVLYAKE